MLYEFLGFRVSGEYAPSAFQNWYSQIDTFIKEIPLKHRSKKNKTEYSMIIDNYWGIVHYKTTKLNNRLIFIIEKFDFDYPNLFNWLQNHEYPTQLSAPPLKWFKKKLEPIAHKYHIIKVY